MTNPLAPKGSNDPAIATPLGAASLALPSVQDLPRTRAYSTPFLEPIRHLADAAVDLIEPLWRRSVSDNRYVLVDKELDFSVYVIKKGRVKQVAGTLADLEQTPKRVREIARSKNVELRLDPEKIIKHRLSLPLDGRDFLDAIIAHRLERLTPWKPDKVLYGFAVSSERSDSGGLDVDFVGTSMDLVDDCRNRIDALKIAPTTVGSAAEPLERPVAIDLLRGSGDRRRAARRRVLRTIFLAVLPLTAALFVISALVLGSATQRLADAETALALERSTLGSAANGNTTMQAAIAMIEEKRAAGALFLLIDQLAAEIPTDTFLSHLEIAPNVLRLRGNSANAPALIPILEVMPRLQNVRFEAPVAREPNGRDRFDIIAVLENGDAPAASQ